LKILPDENMPHQLRGHLPNHDVSTAVYVGFGGFTNGELLQAAEVAGFEVLLTGDLSLEYQQNLTGRKIAIVCYRRIAGGSSGIMWRQSSRRLERLRQALSCAWIAGDTEVKGIEDARSQPQTIRSRGGRYGHLHIDIGSRPIT
jgi:predicted nuclease of predicted toxin-antitoxin system